MTRRRILFGAPAFILLVGVVGFGIWLLNGSNDSTKAAQPASAPPERSVNVVVTTPQRVLFERAISIQGNVEAKHVATVSPRIAGVLDTIFVDEGDTVQAGQTELFQTDAVRLAKTVEVRRHEVDVAQHEVREKQALVEQEQANFDKAEYDLRRYRELYEQAASSNDELEDAETEYRVSAAQLKLAHAQVDLADAQFQQAHSSLAIAQKDLDDSLIVAPISGYVVERLREPGEMGTPGAPVLRIEDPTLVEVSVYLPARAYGEVIVGTTQMHVTVNGVDLDRHAISYKSPTIDPQLRTFEARCLLQNPPAAVAPGAMAQVRVVLARHEALGVSRDAVQDRGGGKIVFVVDDGHARLVPVRIGLEQDGLVEVSSDQLSETDQVIATGGYFLDPGDAVTVVPETRP